MHPVCFSPARLRAIRDDRGHSRRTLANSCGMSAAAIKDYEIGRRTPGADALGRLAAELGCSVDDFYIRFAFEQLVPDAV
jgi:transcriptional regulator with XRE-family HTH domain